MCGRFAQTSTRKHYAQLLGLKAHGDNFGEVIPQYDLRPSMCPTLIRWFGSEPTLLNYYWGFLPYWTKDPKGLGGNRPINARVESAATNGMFRHAWAKQRCLIPADAFYEWKPVDAKHKQRFCLRRKDGEPMMFAGLWDIWTPSEGGDSIPTCTILTGAPNEVAAAIHDRMPVILPREVWQDWLSPELTRPDQVRALVSVMPAGELEAFPVTNDATDKRLFERV